MVEYQEDDMLMLSGIQHYMFCPRQWALIHVEQQWSDNRLTTEGTILHRRVDDPKTRQKVGDVITLRSVNIASKRLGLYGLTDAVELVPSDGTCNAIIHPSYPGYWKVYPVEYKHGHAKPDERDEVQLAAQCMCLEEMYNIHIDSAAIFYWETRHREIVNITERLRSITIECAEGMHSIMKNGVTPSAVSKPHCKNCSLVDLCMPSIGNAKQYLDTYLYEETS